MNHGDLIALALSTVPSTLHTHRKYLLLASENGIYFQLGRIGVISSQVLWWHVDIIATFNKLNLMMLLLLILASITLTETISHCNNNNAIGKWEQKIATRNIIGKRMLTGKFWFHRYCKKFSPAQWCAVFLMRIACQSWQSNI